MSSACSAMDRMQCSILMDPNVRGATRRRRWRRPRLNLPLHHRLLDLGDRLRGVEALGTDLGAIHDGVAAIELERVFERIEPFALMLVAAIGDPALRL